MVTCRVIVIRQGARRVTAFAGHRRRMDVVIYYHCNGGSFSDYAKSRGSCNVTDFVIIPKHPEIEQSKRVRWLGWEVRDAIKRVTAHREMRERMSRAAARRDDNTCGQRFQAIISKLTGQPVAVAG